jgi:hypothetical protein
VLSEVEATSKGTLKKRRLHEESMRRKIEKHKNKKRCAGREEGEGDAEEKRT